MKLETPLYKNLRKIKLLVYAQGIGAITPFKNFVSRLLSIGKSSKNHTVVVHTEAPRKTEAVQQLYLSHFKSLVATYGYDKNRFVLLLDAGITPSFFLNYLEQNQFKYIDFGKALSTSKKPTTLIYDRHWNDHGRELIAGLIVNYINSNNHDIE